MSVLVTGLDGFTGHYVQKDLEAHGEEVVGLVSDLTDENAVATELQHIKPKAVIHLAGISFVGHGNTNAFYEVNLIGTRNLLQGLAQLDTSVQSILLVSSANVYGNRAEGVLSEGSSPDPVNDYAVSKLAMEQMANLWVDRLPLFITRPFNYTGVNQEDIFLIPKIVSHFCQKKTVIELGNIDVWREFGDVRSVAVSYRKLLEMAPRGETFNISTGKTYSLSEVIDLCEKMTGHSIEVKVNQGFVRSNEVRVLSGDNSRLINCIGKYDHYSLKDTLRWMLDTSSGLQK